VTRRHWGAAILAVWAASLGWLVKREYFRPTGARLAEAALAVSPGALYYHIGARGRQVGFASTTVDTLIDSIRVEDLLVLDEAALGAVRRSTARSTAVLTRALRLRSVVSDIAADGRSFAAQGTVADDTAFRLTLRAGHDSETVRWGLARPVVVPSLLALRLAFGGELTPGNTYTTRLFDPVLLTERDVRARVGAESTFVVADSAEYDSTAMAWVPVRFDTVRAFAVDEERSGGRTRQWVDAQGRLVRAEYPGGLVVQRSAFEVAYENFRRRDTLALIRASAHPPPGAVVPLTALAAGVRPGEPAAAFRVRVSGLPPAAVGVGTGTVTRRGDTLEVTRPDLASLPSRMLPLGDSAAAAWLGSEPLIPWDDPRLVAQSRQIVGRERNARRAAELLVAWVHGEIQPGPGAALPGAVATLATRRGDAGDQAALLVGLARAAGIPARPVAGLLFADDRFYYHAWAELFIGEWVAADPVTGEFPAGAGRIGLAIDGLARHAELAPLAIQLVLEVL
jgi:hypothetical protein